MGVFDFISSPFVGISKLMSGGGGFDPSQYGAPNLNAPIPTDPNITSQRSALASMVAPSAIDAEGDYKPQGGSYGAKEYANQALPEYNDLRSQVNESYNRNSSQAKSDLERTYAAGGNLNSGAYAKQLGNLDTQMSQQNASDIRGVGTQEAMARRQLQTQEDNKAFQSNEAAAGRNFQGQQAVASRNAARQTFNAQQGNQFNQWKVGAGTQLDQIDLADKNAQQQQKTDAYNAAMGMYQSKHSGGLLGSGGFLGTGIGA